MKRREPACVDCGASISPRATRCRACAGRKVGLQNEKRPRHDCLQCGQECKRPEHRYCSRACFAVSQTKVRGEAHHSWKDNPSRATLHKRAQMMFAAEPCEVCGTTEQIVRHHKDENPKNNTRENIAFLCRAHHASHHHGPRPLV